MTSTPRVLAAGALLVLAAAAFLACGEDEPKAPAGGAPGGATSAAAAETDTGATALATWKAFYRPGRDRVPHELATNPGTPWGDYVGSKACKECHPKDYADWRDSFHSRTLYDTHPGTVFGDFSGDFGTFDDPKHPSSVRPFTKDGRFYMEVVRKRIGVAHTMEFPRVEDGVFEVLYAFGNRRHQPYVGRSTDGRYWIMPVYWDDVKRTFSWDGWRPYVRNCASCHVTGIKTEDQPIGDGMPIGMTQPRKFTPPAEREGWSEGAVGCEVCHGPGRVHVEKATAMGNDAYRAYLKDGGAPTIYDPAKDTPEHRAQQCSSCHTFFSESSITFVPGPKGYPHDPLYKVPKRGPTGAYYENGTEMSICSVERMLRHSKMGSKGVECRDCHDPHGNTHWAELTESAEDNTLCLKCHKADASGAFADAAAVARHARHKPDGPGILCVECHMPRDKRFSEGLVVMSAELHSHAMSIPTGYESERGGPPSACNMCHKDRDALWTRKTLEAWRRK
jgi:predicted CXXCH cytochrome family protein